MTVYRVSSHLQGEHRRQTAAHFSSLKIAEKKLKKKRKNRDRQKKICICRRQCTAKRLKKDRLK